MAYANSFRRSAGRKPVAPARKMGTWKLAYADFLTALCAFFLVMRIVHGVSAEDKSEIARQFGGDVTSVTTASAAPSEAENLAETLRNDVRLSAFGSSVAIRAEPDAVRINLTDMDMRPLFESGKGALNASGAQLVHLTGQVVSGFSLPISIEGHTDSNPSEIPGYSNWELSADRANSARRLMEQAGVDPSRFVAVTGLSDTQPLLNDAPHLPANRRISIVLLLNRASDRSD